MLLMVAIRNLAQRLRRTLLLGMAVAVVTGLMVLLLGLSQGVRSTMVASGLALSSGHVNVGGFYKTMPGQVAGVITDYARLLPIIEREVPGLQQVVSRGRGYVSVISDTRTLKKDLVGIDPAGEPRLTGALRITSGSLDELRQPGTLLLFEEQAKKLDVKVGDRLTLVGSTFRGSNNAIDVRLAAIAKDMGLESSVTTFADTATWRQLFLMAPATTGVLQLYLEDPYTAPAVHARLREVLLKEGYALLPHDSQIYWMKFDTLVQQDWTGQRLDLNTWLDDEGVLAWIFGGLNVLSGLLVVFLVLLISLGVSNTMWIAVRARTRELGALRAIGMGRRSVLMMVLLEGLLLGVAGTGLGALLGWAAGALANQLAIPLPPGAQLVLMSDHLLFAIDAVDLVASAALITGVLGVMSYFPARAAARLEPVSALSHTS